MSSRDPGFEHHLTAVDVAAKGRDRSARPGFGVRLVHGLEAERAHWFYWVPVALGLGIGIYFALPFEPSAGVAGLALGAVLALRFALRAGSPWRLALDIVALIVAGFALIGLRTAWVSAPVLDKRLGPVEVRGHVEQVEAREGRG